MYNECDEEQGAYVITDPCSVNKEANTKGMISSRVRVWQRGKKGGERGNKKFGNRKSAKNGFQGGEFGPNGVGLMSRGLSAGLAWWVFQCCGEI